MARVILSLIIVLAFAVTGCRKPEATWHHPTSSATTRPSAIPLSDVLTLATQADIGAAANAAADPAISKAVSDYLGPGAPRWYVAAARDIGDHVLLWVGFPEVADGGIDLVYSKLDRRVKWQFKGGERG